MSLAHFQVGNEAEALVYLTDCTLATIEGLATLSRPPKGELKRQAEIAQHGITWIKLFGSPASGRPAVVINHGLTVAEWIEKEFGVKL